MGPLHCAGPGAAGTLLPRESKVPLCAQSWAALGFGSVQGLLRLTSARGPERARVAVLTHLSVPSFPSFYSDREQAWGGDLILPRSRAGWMLQVGTGPTAVPFLWVSSLQWCRSGRIRPRVGCERFCPASGYPRPTSVTWVLVTQKPVVPSRVSLHCTRKQRPQIPLPVQQSPLHLASYQSSKEILPK